MSVHPDRASLQESVNQALIKEQLGAVVAGGSGRFYSYIDLALTHVTAAAEVIRDVLQRGKQSKRSWLMFFDVALWDEWIGIWPDTPAPPLKMGAKQN